MSLIAHQVVGTVRSGDYGLLERLEQTPPHHASLKETLALIDRVADFIEQAPALDEIAPDEADEAFVALDTLRAALSKTIWNNDQGLTPVLDAEAAIGTYHDERRYA